MLVLQTRKTCILKQGVHPSPLPKMCIQVTERQHTRTKQSLKDVEGFHQKSKKEQPMSLCPIFIAFQGVLQAMETGAHKAVSP